MTFGIQTVWDICPKLGSHFIIITGFNSKSVSRGLLTESEISEIEQRLRMKFNDRGLLNQVFTHKSLLNELPKGEVAESNERLEFLGDAVIELAVSDYLFRTMDKADEEALSKARASYVSKQPLAVAARRLSLGKYLKFSKSLKATGEDHEKLLEDAFEALIGAIFLDQGHERASSFTVEKLLNIGPKNETVK
jgi:ribonuclease-3